MNFAEAMRKADDMNLPTIRRDYFDWPDDSEVPYTCAIGGANLVRLVPQKTDRALRYSAAPTDLVEPLNRRPCPVGCSEWRSRTSFVTIIHLFDVHQWSRTQIADWLEREYTPEELEW